MTEADTLDNQGGAAEALRHGEVPEGEIELARNVAKRMGWTPKEEWKRDPSKWVDAPEFLEQTPRELESVKDRLKRTAQAAEAAIEDARRTARIDAQREVREAAEAQDPERAQRAAERLAEVSGPPPQTVAWMGRNAWFNEDPDAQALAVAVIQRGAAAKQTIEQQLEAAEAAVRQRFPEHFGEVRREPEPRTETRLSERAPPVVAQGNRGVSTAPKEKTFADIPPGDRALYQRHFARSYQARGLSEADAQAKYATAYWANKGE